MAFVSTSTHSFGNEEKMKASPLTLPDDHAAFMKWLSSGGEEIAKSLGLKPTLLWHLLIDLGILTKNPKPPSSTSSRCASMETLDSSIQPAAAEAPSEQPERLVPRRSSDSNSAKSTPESLEQRYAKYLERYHGLVAPKSFEKWKEILTTLSDELDQLMSPEEHFNKARADECLQTAFNVEGTNTGKLASHERAVVTCEQGEIRLFVYHGSDRMSAPLTRERATALAHDILSKVLESSR
jgi:hypothetical protein